MKIIGQFIGDELNNNYAKGSLIALEVNCARIQVWLGIEDERRYDIKVAAGIQTFTIWSKNKTNGRGLLKLEEANAFIKDIMTKQYLDLELYNYGIAGVCSLEQFIPNEVYVGNQTDDEGDAIPLKVQFYKDELDD